MRMLAIDPGTRCGWAVGDGQVDVSGTWDIKPRRGESAGARYLRLLTELERVREAFPDLALIVYEQAHHRGGAATEYANGCVTHIQAFCERHGLQFAGVHTSKVKMKATGKGNSKKDAVMEAARRRWPNIELASDDHADALWLWAYAQGEYGG
jgi:Holliday junction resolvasome RuvABC endonuclease subunit